MPALKNTRHEAFAQNLAKGMTADEAHTKAGYTPNRRNAARLKTNEDIMKRIAELQGKAAERTIVTVESLTNELEEARQLATANNQGSAAVAAVMGKAKLHGHLIEKRQHSGAIATYDLSHATDDELQALANLIGPVARSSDTDEIDSSGAGKTPH